MRRKMLLGVITAALLGISCSSDHSIPLQTNTDDNSSITNTSSDNVQATGSLTLNLSNGDDPTLTGLAKNKIDSVEHIYLTITKVLVHIAEETSENGWKTVATPNKQVDFLELVNGVTAPLNLFPLPAGHYTQIRLMLSEDGEYCGQTIYANTIVINGKSFPLTIPSALRTGIKCVQSFFISENETTEICLSFDVRKAVHYAPGNGYMMKPAFRTYKCDATDNGAYY
jgi:hypothetical protein